MTIYNCVYKTITNPRKIREIYRDKDIAMLDSIVEKYDNCIQFCNLKRTLNMLKDSYIVGEGATYDIIQKRLQRNGRVYICSMASPSEVNVVKIWK